MNRAKTAKAISQLMPFIIQGAHIGAMNIKGITQAQFFVLIVLHTSGPMTMQALANRVGVRLPTLTGLINRLTKSGYVKRMASLHDRRQVVIVLTNSGHRMLEQFQSVLRKRWEDVLAILPDKQVVQFFNIVDRLMKRLSAR